MRRSRRPWIFAAILVLSLAGCASRGIDAVSKATSTIAEPWSSLDPQGASVLIILAASRKNSTAKIATSMAAELKARLVSPEQVDLDGLKDYALIGFGSGIFDQMHHKSILDAADRLPPLPGRKVFIFSTSGVARQYAIEHGIDDPHTPLRDKLLAKGCIVVDEYNCAGFNDNSFLRFFGGMNKGRPNEDDIRRAAAFAGRLQKGQGENQTRP